MVDSVCARRAHSEREATRLCHRAMVCCHGLLWSGKDRVHPAPQATGRSGRIHNPMQSRASPRVSLHAEEELPSCSDARRDRQPCSLQVAKRAGARTRRNGPSEAGRTPTSDRLGESEPDASADRPTDRPSVTGSAHRRAKNIIGKT
jgi:hypothetical protein